MRRSVIAALAGMSVVAQAQAQGAKIVVAENFGPRAGFALETDDAQVLTRAGCLEALTRIDFDGTLKPSLAVSWSQTSPTSWDFKLRPGAKFQDGEALTAAHAATALTAALNAKTPARSFSPRTVKSVDAVGPDVVRVTTPAPSVLVPFVMASPNTGILSSAGYKDGKINPQGTCSGPFTITEINGQQSLQLKRNDSYWGGAVTLAAAEVKFLPDANVRATQVRTGESQIGRTVPATQLATLQRGPNTTAVAIDTPRTSQLLINNKKAPLDRPKVRQALQAALDLRGIVASLYEGSAQAAVGPFSSVLPWSPRGAAPAAYDVNKAKLLLAEAGVQPGSLTLELLAYSEKTEFKDLSAIIQEQFKAIGVIVNIRIAAYSALEPDMLGGKYDLALLSRSHLTDVADPVAFLTSDYGCKGGYNISQHCDAAMDEQLTAIAGEADPAKRHAVYASIGKKLQDDAVTIFVVHERGSDAVSTRVKNYALHPLYHYTLTPRLALD
jgi:peptide/nickel transport system substrate-binding protein